MAFGSLEELALDQSLEPLAHTLLLRVVEHEYRPKILAAQDLKRKPLARSAYFALPGREKRASLSFPSCR